MDCYKISVIKNLYNMPKNIIWNMTIHDFMTFQYGKYLVSQLIKI